MVALKQAIAAAEHVLSQEHVPTGQTDVRWQAIISIGQFVETDPDDVWLFIERWGKSKDADLRQAIGTCLLEHLLEHWFDRFFSRVETAVKADDQFARTFLTCWTFGEADVGSNKQRFDALRAEAARSVSE